MKTSIKTAIIGDVVRFELYAEQPNIQSIKAPVCEPHDDAVYNHYEVIEVFLQPGENTSYGHFAFDCYGNTFDELMANGPDSWNPDWKVETSRGKDFWSAKWEIRLSELERLGVTLPASGVIWRLNIMRLETPSGSVSAFTPTKNYGFHTPEFFGVLRMSKK